MIAHSADMVPEGYELLFDLAWVGMAWVDAETRRFLKVNDRLTEMTGYSKQELSERTSRAITHPEDQDLDDLRYATAHVAARPICFEKRFLHKGGSIVWLQVSQAFFVVAGSKRLIAAETYRDVTDERAPGASTQTEERLRLSLESAGIGIWEIDRESGHLYWDRQHRAIFGTEGDDHADCTEALRNAVEPQPNSSTGADAGSILLNPQPFRIRRASDGEERWIQSFGSTSPASGHRPERIMGIVIDRTEEVRARLALEESEEHYRHAIELNPQVPWTAAPDGAVESFSERWLTITGLRRDEALGNGWIKVVHPDDLGFTAEAWKRCIETGEPGDVEYRVRYADGQYRWMRARAFPRFNERGEVIRWYGNNEDVHERKLAQEHLEQRVRQRTAELESFVHTVAHDLRGPMRAIGGTSQILLEDFSDDLPEEARRLLTRQAQAVIRLNSLVEGLLRYALLGMVDLNRSTVDLSAMASAVAADIERRYPSLRFEIEPGIRVNADPACLRTLIDNLFENAAKYSPEGGTVRFGRSPGEAAGTFQVADEGIGFDPRNKEKIFDPFARLVSDNQFPGTGLGLASVRRVAEMHGGRAWADSAPGKGATFYFTLAAET